jgi:hypothetical protein
MSSRTILTRIDAVLKPLGFAWHKVTWNRKSPPFVDVIDVQTSKAGDSMTLNAGVLHQTVHSISWGTEPAAVIQAPSCTVHVRVGQLVDGKDVWWQLDDQAILDDVVGKLGARVLPFLTSMHSIVAMVQFLMSTEAKRKYPDPWSIIYLAILKSEQGDNAGACVLLAEFRKKAGEAWKSRIGEVSARLGCSEPIL